MMMYKPTDSPNQPKPEQPGLKNLDSDWASTGQPGLETGLDMALTRGRKFSKRQCLMISWSEIWDLHVHPTNTGQTPKRHACLVSF